MASPNSVSSPTPNYQASYQIVTTGTYSPAQVDTVTAVDNATTLTVTGVKAAVAATAGTPAKPADEIINIRPVTGTNGIVVVSARVTADDTVTVKFANVTAGNITPTASAYILAIVSQDAIKYSFEG